MNNVPTHVALIMDGNGRWAQSRGLARTDGHRHGATIVKKVLREAQRLGIKYITLFAFSTENFARPRQEVDFLLKLFEKFLKKYNKTLVEKKIRFRAIGNLFAFPKSLQEAINNLANKTEKFNDFNLTIALNYGAREEIVHAVKSILAENSLNAEDITWEIVKKHLYTSDLPDPDLIIRTSGERRLSNFLLLQAAYSELYFTDVFWPDFNEKEFTKAIENYQKRERRMGKINEKTNI